MTWVGKEQWGTQKAPSDYPAATCLLITAVWDLSSPVLLELLIFQEKLEIYILACNVPILKYWQVIKNVWGEKRKTLCEPNETCLGSLFPDILSSL